MWEFLALISSLLTCTLVCADLRGAGLDRHVIFHYDFEGHSNTSVIDASGYGNDATLRTSQSLTRNRTACGQGIELKKTSLEIQLNKTWSNYTNNSTSWNFGLTIAVWIWIDKIKQPHAVFNSYNKRNGNRSNRFFHFGVSRKGGIQWVMKARPWPENRTFKLNCTNTTILKEKQWYHVAVTYEWRKASHTAMFFLDGTTHENCSKSITRRPKPGNLPRLGWHPEIGSRNNRKYFRGIMDDYYIFNKALNQTELAEVMKCKTAPTIDLKPASTTEANPETTSTTEVNNISTTPQPPSTTKEKPTTFVPTKEATLTTEVTETSTAHQTTTSEVKTTSTPHQTITSEVKKTSTPQQTTTSEVKKTSTPQQRQGNIERYINNITDSSGAKEFLLGYFSVETATYETASNDELIGRTLLLENIGLTLARNVLEVNQSLTVVTKSVLMSIYIPASPFKFPSAKEIGSQNRNETIQFPDEIIDTESKVPRAVVCVSYTDLHKHMNQTIILSSSSVKSRGALQLNSKIIGAAVDPPLTKPLKHPIEVAFSHEPVAQGRQICSFWNHSITTSDGKRGQWSTHGCELDQRRTTPTQTVCLCNHLTNFALLLQREGVEYSNPPLSMRIITIIGCSFSILACILCFVMFLTVKKKDIRHYLHINLSVAVAVSQIILLFGITKTKYKVLCKVFAISLHYFYLVAFVFMLSESVHLAILIESAFTYGDIKLPVYLITSWGVPFLIVGITLAARFDNYGGDKACFISPEKGTIYAFVGPFGLVLAINFVILIIVLRQVVMKTSLPICSKAASKFEIARATVRSLVILFPVMGFTWLFGILFFGFQTLALEYLFGIFCSLQGFFIFLFQFVLNTENRSAFLRATQRWRKSTFSSRNESGSVRGQSFSKHAPEVKNEELKKPMVENCHLLVYRKVDGETINTFV